MKLIIMKGLPGSGKTTRAQQLSEELKADVISTDDMRKTHAPQYVRLEYMGQVEAALNMGQSVVADATNFGTWEHELRDIAHKYVAEVQVEFMDTPVLECIRRDNAREEGHKVGAAAIRGMYNTYLRQNGGADALLT